MLEHSQVVDEAWKDEGHRLSEDASEHHAWKVVVVKEVGRTFNNKNFSCSATAPLLTPVTAFASVQVECMCFLIQLLNINKNLFIIFNGLFNI